MLALTLFYEVRLRLGNKNKNYFSFHCARLVLTLLRKVRLRLNNENKNIFFFSLCSPCTNFAPKYKVK